VQEVLVQRRRNVEERCEAIDKTWDEVSKLSANGLHASLAEEWDGDQERKLATTGLQDGGQDGIQRVAPALQFVQVSFAIPSLYPQEKPQRLASSSCLSDFLFLKICPPFGNLPWL
jgi:hypothetical protein